MSRLGPSVATTADNLLPTREIDSVIEEMGGFGVPTIVLAEIWYAVPLCLVGRRYG